MKLKAETCAQTVNPFGKFMDNKNKWRKEKLVPSPDEQRPV
jgi:hypothetical protein